MFKKNLMVAGVVVAVALSVLSGRGLTAAVSLDGLWDAVVVAGGNDAFEVPFRFEIATRGAETEGFFFEGDRKIGSTSGKLVDDTLTLEYDFLNTTLELKRTGEA